MPPPTKLTGRTKHHIAPFEVVIHNKPNDCWVSFLGKVVNVTPLIEEFKDENCVRPLIEHAGKDISNWFDEKTGDIANYVNPVSGVLMPHCNYGLIPHVNVGVPGTTWKPIKCPWWKDPVYEVGPLSKRVRPIRIVNMITCQECQINVCCEDSITRIAERYSIFNSDPDSYTWTHNKCLLNMNKNLEENLVIDERDKFTDLGFPQNTYIPLLTIYYNDDLRYEDL